MTRSPTLTRAAGLATILCVGAGGSGCGGDGNARPAARLDAGSEDAARQDSGASLDDPARKALATGDFRAALSLCVPDADAGVTSCDARWCELLARFGLVMDEMNDYVLPTFRSADLTAFDGGGVDLPRLTRVLDAMTTLSAGVDPIVVGQCRADIPKLPFRFGDAADPVVRGEWRGTWTPRAALFLGAAIDSIRHIFLATAGLVPPPSPPPGSDVPALPPLLESVRARLAAHDGLLFSEPAEPGKTGGLSLADGGASELLVDLFDPDTGARVYDFTGAEVVRGEALALGRLVEPASLPLAACEYRQWHVDTLFDRDVGTTDGLAFSNDGTTIVFPRKVGDDYQLHAAGVDGTGARCLTCDHVPVGWNDGVRWQPGGAALVFVSTRDHPYAVGGAGGGFGQELYAMRPDGTGATRLTTSHAWATNYHVNFSPDGRRIVWGTTEQRTWDVMVADFVDDSAGFRLENVRRLTHDTTWWETHGFDHEGRRVLGTNTRAGFQSADLYALDVETGARVRLTDDPAWDEHCHLSPDGRKLSWISGRWAPASVLGLTDGALSAAHDFFWIGPGIFFDFLAPPVGFTTELTLMDADGGDVRALTTDGEVVADNVWSPDSRRILFRQTPTRSKAPAKIRLLTFDDCRP